MKQAFRILIVGLIVLGMAIAVINFISPTLNAGGWVEKEGTFPGDELRCPDKPKDCVHRIYVE